MGTAQSEVPKGCLQSCSPYLGPSVITSSEQDCCWLWVSMGTRIKASRRIPAKFSTEEIQQLPTAWILQRNLCQNPSLKIALKSREAIEFSHEDRSKKKKKLRDQNIHCEVSSQNADDQGLDGLQAVGLKDS